MDPAKRKEQRDYLIDIAEKKFEKLSKEEQQGLLIKGKIRLQERPKLAEAHSMGKKSLIDVLCRYPLSSQFGRPTS